MAQILVHCNPFAALDHNGIPCGVFPFDPEHAGGSRRWIGASVDMDATKGRTTAEALKGSAASAPVRVTDGKRTVVEDVIARTRTVFAFDLGAQPIPSPPSKHYRDGVRDGSLFPADLASAKALGIAAKDFSEPTKAIAAARDAAIAHWVAAGREPPPVESWPVGLRGIGAAVADEKTVRNALVKTTAAEPAKDDAK